MLKEAKELAAVTFRPDLSPSRQRAGGDFAVSARATECHMQLQPATSRKQAEFCKAQLRADLW